MHKIEVRAAKQEELDWINSKYKEVNFKISDFENEFIVIAKIKEEKAGLGRLVKIDDENIELGGIYVFPNFRRSGVADAIVSTLCKDNPYRNSTIWCLPFENLVIFYNKFGFEKGKKNKAPTAVLQKLDWCNSGDNYDKKVVLLCKE